MTYTLMSGSQAVTRDADGAYIPADPANADWRAYQAWLAAPNSPNPAPAPPTPERRAALSALLDPLSTAQRALITADHMMRLQAEAADHPGGLPIGNSKVGRAAADMGLKPEAWFALAGA